MLNLKEEPANSSFKLSSLITRTIQKKEIRIPEGEARTLGTMCQNGRVKNISETFIEPFSVRSAAARILQ